MKTELIYSAPENTRLILIFNGWSAGNETVRDIHIPGWDLAVVSDYSDSDFDSRLLDQYYTIYLFAWSLGVRMAETVLPADKVTAAFAINGTLTPVDDSEGIPTEIFKGTEEHLDTRNLKKFRMRMAGSKETFQKLWGELEEDEEEIAQLRNQLRYVMRESEKSLALRLPWTRVFLSRNDHIFPFGNMSRHWAKDPDVQIIEMDADHYVELGKIVSSVISDPTKVSKRFTEASVTYDTNAIAQYSAAIKLADKFSAMNPRQGCRVLEIGCGTGLFTREYSRLIDVAEAIFVDITETGPFGIAPSERYVVEDAEKWIEKFDEQVDAIVSASAIQWFADIPRFLGQCHKRLSRGGVLAISTFVPGNMEELDSLRPSPILYPKKESLREWMLRDFDDVEVEEDEIKVEFRSVREMLMHLKHTGVGGSSNWPTMSIRKMSHLRSLTYRPVYITGLKK